jgi:hypothetical protein
LGFCAPPLIAWGVVQSHPQGLHAQVVEVANHPHTSNGVSTTPKGVTNHLKGLFTFFTLLFLMVYAFQSKLFSFNECLDHYWKKLQGPQFIKMNGMYL